MKKYIIGYHYGHDPNIGILNTQTGKLQHLENERITRIKHGQNFWNKNYKDIYSLLYDIYSIKKEEIECIAVPVDISHKRRINELKVFFDFINVGELIFDRAENLISEVEKYSHFKIDNVIFIRHHIAHGAYSFYTSNFHKSLIFSYDGIGFVDSPAMSMLGDSNSLHDFIHYPKFHVGFLYHIITNMIFYVYYGKKAKFWEGKTMALSSYGSPRFLPLIKENFEEGNPLESIDLKKYNTCFGHGTINEHNYPTSLSMVEKIHRDIYGQTIDLNKSNLFQYCCDLARSWQDYFEEKVIEGIKKLKEKYNQENICISGGCGLNGIINYKLKQEFRNVYIPPATSDCGIGIGSALYAYHDIFEGKRLDYKNVAYIGLKYKIEEEIFKSYKVKYRKSSNVCKEAARAIADKKIIAWYQAASESGPRALGNRSILCDPSDKEMKNILNEKVKHREWFRPFAPAILKDFVSEYFEDVEDEKYMLKIAKVKADKVDRFPAAIHIDGTGRLQTVGKEDNKKFYNLIKEFYNITGLPIVLNTSFNVGPEPIVNSPKDALNTFVRSNIDMLFMGDYVITRRPFEWAEAL